LFSFKIIDFGFMFKRSSPARGSKQSSVGFDHQSTPIERWQQSDVIKTNIMLGIIYKLTKKMIGSYGGVDIENVERVGVSVGFISVLIASSQLARIFGWDLLTSRCSICTDERQWNTVETAESASSHSGSAGRYILPRNVINSNHQ